MMETMCNIKEYLEIIKVDNEKLLKAKEEQEEINEILLKFLTNRKQNKSMGQLTSNGEKRSPKEVSHKWKERESTYEDSESVELYDKAIETRMLYESSTSKEFSHPSKRIKGIVFELQWEFRNIDHLFKTVKYRMGRRLDIGYE